jgi:DNA-binding winged helix-turn-helix (wHTH) protein/TolB-like protein
VYRKSIATGDRINSNSVVSIDQERFRFGSFEFDASSGDLRRDGLVVSLQAEPARVLSHLVNHAGQIVAREDLHDAILGEETFVDFERGLNDCIAQIRSALGDESTSPKFIRTIPRRGYQFIYPVERFPAAARIEPTEETGEREFLWRTLLICVAGLAIVAAVLAVTTTLRRTATASAPFNVAVIPFDNETGDAGVNRFCKELTDNFVQQLTATGEDHYHVIGNASILRTPREQRDMARIAASLHAQFVILGQVQGGGTQTRILAHLIRMPDQTHVWVVRLEQPFDNPYALESTAAHEIAQEFSSKLADPTVHTDLSPQSNN